MADLIVERSLLCSITEPIQLQTMLRAGVQPNNFTELRSAAEFILNYYQEHLAIPPIDILDNAFPEHAWQPVAGFDYWLGRFIEVDTQRQVSRILTETVPKLKTDAVGAVEEMRQALSGLGAARGMRSTISLTDRDALNRLSELRGRQMNRHRNLMVSGIPTGLSTIDNTGMGWQYGDLNGVVAGTGVGKSWLLLYTACAAYRSGHRVLFISPEMNRQMVEMRVDVILAHMDGIELSNKGLQEGQNIDIAVYEQHLSRMAGREDWITIDMVEDMELDLAMVTRWVQEYQPEILLIDGLAFMLTGEGEIWQQVHRVCYGLKRLCEARRLVGVLSNQAKAEVRLDKIPRLNQCAFGQDFARACDRVIGLANHLTDEKLRVWRMDKNRHGEPLFANHRLMFDVDTGHIYDMGRRPDEAPAA